MKKAVVVSVKNRQIINGQEESIEVVTPGTFYKKGDAYYVVYDETEISGMQGTTTTLKIEEGKVSLIRFGTTSSRVNFKAGFKDVSLYRTPYGVMEFCVNPETVDININDDGGEIKLVYELGDSGQKASANELLIKVK